MKQTAFAVLAVLASAASVSAGITAGETARLEKAARVVQDIQASIPQDYWDRARCVAVIPELRKAAFIVGGEYGKGVMSCRAGDRWSAPVFMQIAKGSWGFQAGAEQVDLVLLVMNENGVQKLLSNQVTLGADASVAAGPVGAQGHVGTDARMTAEIVSYSRAKGLFAGIDLSGGVLRADEDANGAVYGGSATPRTILASRDISAPTQAAPFLRALGATGPAATAAPPSPAGAPSPSTAASSTPATPRATTMPTTDDDLRTQLTQMQQTVDRMLAAPSAPVGTTGTAAGANAGATVTIERAQLVQLRRQIDALLATLNRR